MLNSFGQVKLPIACTQKPEKLPPFKEEVKKKGWSRRFWK
jgi:hypothetical protein